MSISPTYHIAFDIDNTLAFRQKNASREMIAFFKQQGDIIDAIEPHFIPPGVKELMQLLCKMENVRVSFFSSGHKIRNDLFVPQLLQHSLGEDVYRELKDRVLVLSGEDLVKSVRGGRFDFYSGVNQKDLRKVVSDARDLPNAVLVEDDPTFVAGGQGKNLLKAPYIDSESFETKYNRSHLYGEDSSRFIKICVETKGFAKGWMEKVAKEGNCIGVRMVKGWIWREEPQFVIGFTDRTSYEYREVFLRDVKLNKRLWKLYMYGKRIDEYPPEVLQYIRSIVELNGGKTRKIWREPNRIYYMAGLLFAALGAAKQEGISLSESLFRIYSKEEGEDGSYEKAIRRHKKQDDLYWKGLELLRSVNPNLYLITPHNMGQKDVS